MVKRFLTARSGSGARANRYAPETEVETPAFTLRSRKAIAPSEAETQANPRARSAKLRVATRTDAPAGQVDPKSIGMPQVRGGI